ncbi:MAG TPA: hypothetical protein VF310_01610 [Vicinamibacteria bacterium]
MARKTTAGGSPPKAKPAAPRRRSASPRPAAAAAPAAELARVVGALDDVAAGLQFAHQSFTEALLHLPRAEDYEPLVAPLREFARTSPALAEALREVVKATAPLHQAVSAVQATGRQLAAALAAPAATPPQAAPPLDEIASRVQAAHEAILEALADLPSGADYAPFAAQLRELATVSPSLMEWLQEVPKVATPLGDAVRKLRDAALDLKLARDLLRAVNS